MTGKKIDLKGSWPIIAVLAAAAVLLFANLGNQYLWQDEAETAVLAKNTLKYGFPRAFDGKNLVTPTIRTGYGEDYAWKYHPWGQFYIAALSFKLFGFSTTAARLPFALLGLANVFLLYILAVYLTSNRFIATCAACLMTFSVPYLLLMRQCRYYAPAVFLVLVTLLFYVRFLRGRSWKDLAVSSVALIALCYTVHGMFVPVFAAVGLHYVIFSFDKKTFLPVVTAAVIVAGAASLWFLQANNDAHTAAVSPGRLIKNLEFQVRMINKFIIPLGVFSGVYALWVVWKRKFTVDLKPQEKETLKLLSVLVLTTIAAFCFAQERNFRYLVYLIPVFAIVQGMILLRFAAFNRYFMIGFLGVSLLTGFFNMGYANFLLPKYLYEITHDYDGPVEGIVKFLKENAKEGDGVKIIYGDLPVMFYTDLKVYNAWEYDYDLRPEWVVYRRHWHERLKDKYFTVIRSEYKEHVLDYPDIKWENRPGDIDYHKFRTDTEASGVKIFEKVNR